MKKLFWAIGLAFIVTLVAFQTTAKSESLDSPEHPKSRNIQGQNITGPNDLCGHTIFKFPPPFPDIRFAFMGEFNPNPSATDVIPLSVANCKPETILATTTDPMFILLNQGADADQSLKNLKIRDVPVYIDRNGVRAHIAQNNNSQNPLTPHFVGNREEDITLGEWLFAKGDMTIHCDSQTEAKIKIDHSNLIPNSLYTLWEWWRTVPPGKNEATSVVAPLGGTPNVIMTDDKGMATTFIRHLSFCPLEPTTDGSELLAVVLTWHPDGAVYGVAPSVDFVRGTYQKKDGTRVTSTFPVGIIAQDQMMFPIRLLNYQ